MTKTRILISVDESDLQRIDALADRARMSRSEYLRTRALSTGIDVPEHAWRLVSESATDAESEYVTELLEHHRRDWLGAVQALRAAGWIDGDILSACDALNGHWHTAGLDSAQAIALALSDYERISGLRADLYDDIDAAREAWPERVKSLLTQPDMARCLLVVSREFWSAGGRGGQSLVRLLGRE